MNIFSPSSSRLAFEKKKERERERTSHTFSDEFYLIRERRSVCSTLSSEIRYLQLSTIRFSPNYACEFLTYTVYQQNYLYVASSITETDDKQRHTSMFQQIFGVSVHVYNMISS